MTDLADKYAAALARRIAEGRIPSTREPLPIRSLAEIMAEVAAEADGQPRWRVLYTGSRAVTDRRQVYADLDEVLAEHPVLLVRHGACRKGGDQYAVDWVNVRRSQGHDVMHDPRPAPWPLLGKLAGFMRSGYMCGLGADQCIAHIARNGPSAGTRATATFADWAGIPTTRIECP